MPSPQANERIESINRASSKSQGERLWDEYANYLETMLLNDADNDFALELNDRIRIYAQHFFKKLTMEQAHSLAEYVRTKKIKEITDAHKPGPAQIACICVLFTASFASAGASIVPAAAGMTGNSAAYWNTGATLISNVGITGSGNVKGVFDSMQNGKTAKISAEKDDDMQAINLLRTDVNNAAGNISSCKSEAADAERKRNEAKRVVMNATAGG